MTTSTQPVQWGRSPTMCTLAIAASIALTAILAGCGGSSSSGDGGNGGGGNGGGGDGGGGPATGPTAYYVDSVVLPASAAKTTTMPQVLAVTLKPSRIVLPEWEAAKSQTANAKGPVLQIGAARAVAATATAEQTQTALHWQALPDGSRAAAINIQSLGAYDLRLGVMVSSLPDVAQLRVYSQERPAAMVQTTGVQVNALLAQNRNAGETGAAANTWWTPTVGAGDATLEIVLPAGTPADAVRIAIPTVSHVFQNVSLPTEAALADVSKKDADSCNLDASCADNYALERNAVARMSFTEPDGGSYWCTGTLVNNTKGDFAPYFLTANHCISSQSAASTLETTWFYRSASCNSGAPSANRPVRTGGATLLYASATTDTTFLKLHDMPPAGATLAGWDARSTVQESTPAYSLHHPQGDLLKYSVGAIDAFASCTAGEGSSMSCRIASSTGEFYRVRWSQGITEGGSSGSGLFNGGRVIGTLYGGGSTCRAPGAADYYGRFDQAFNSKLWSWLAG